MNLRVILAGSAIVLAFAGSALAEAPAPAPASPAEVLRALSGCAGIADSGARLACYDNLAPQVKAALAAAPSAVAAKAPPTEEEQRSWFGFDMGGLFGSSPAQQTTPQQFGAENTEAAKEARDNPPPGGPQPIDSISAKLTEYAFNPFGKFVVFLDNGQVWKQIQGDSDHAHFQRNPAENTVTISRGFIGSYNLTINDSNKIYKVTRLK